MEADNGTVYRFRIASDATVTHSGTDGSSGITTITVSGGGDEIVPLDTPTSGTLTFSALNKGQVIGSSWAEGTDSPLGWEDKLYDREGYCQIFKTGMNIFLVHLWLLSIEVLKMSSKESGQINLWNIKWISNKLCFFGYGGASQETGTSAPQRHS